MVTSLQSNNRINIDMSKTPFSTSSRDSVIEQTDKDVLFGRGRPYQDHPGNLYLLQLVKSRRLRFQMKSTPRSEKIAMVEDIVTTIQSQGGRFLKPINKCHKGLSQTFPIELSNQPIWPQPAWYVSCLLFCLS